MAAPSLLDFVADKVLSAHTQKEFATIKSKQDFLEKFGTAFTLSTIMRMGGSIEVKNKCDKDEIVWISTTDIGDARGVSHKLEIIKAIDMLRKIEIYDLMFNKDVKNVLKERIKQKKLGEVLVVNCMFDIHKLTKGRISQSSNKYIHFSFI